jgi:hypothetical protein
MDHMAVSGPNGSIIESDAVWKCKGNPRTRQGEGTWNRIFRFVRPAFSSEAVGSTATNSKSWTSFVRVSLIRSLFYDVTNEASIISVLHCMLEKRSAETIRVVSNKSHYTIPTFSTQSRISDTLTTFSSFWCSQSARRMKCINARSNSKKTYATGLKKRSIICI